MGLSFGTMNTGMADITLKQKIINNLILVRDAVLVQTEIEALIVSGKNLDLVDPIIINTNITNLHEGVPVDSSGGAVTLTLAADSTFNINKCIEIYNVGASATNIVVNTDGTAKFYGDGIADAGVITLTIAKKWGLLCFKKWATNKYFVYLKLLA